MGLRTRLFRAMGLQPVKPQRRQRLMPQRLQPRRTAWTV